MPTTVCPTGHYCPTGANAPTACGVGTYNPTTHAYDPAHCLPCPAGKYCTAKGADAPGGPCDLGFFCVINTELSSPETEDIDSANPRPPRWGPCPPGFYCELGTAYPTPCPVGTFSDNQKNTEVGDCEPCPEGYYCMYTGTSNLNSRPAPVQCEAGFYCPAG